MSDGTGTPALVLPTTPQPAPARTRHSSKHHGSSHAHHHAGSTSKQAAKKALSVGELMGGGLPRAAVKAVVRALDAQSVCRLAQTCALWRDACSGAHKALWKELYFREYPESRRRKPSADTTWKQTLLLKHNLAAQLQRCHRLIAQQEQEQQNKQQSQQQEEEDLAAEAERAFREMELERADPAAAAAREAAEQEAVLVAAAQLSCEHALRAALSRLERAVGRDEARVVAAAGHALRAAARAGSDSAAQLLLQLVPRCAAQRDAQDGTTALHVARTRATTMLLLRAGCSSTARDALGRAPIHTAAALGHIEAVRCLLDTASIACATVPGGDTALHLACAAGQLDVVRLLVTVGASLRCKNAAGQYPLHAAAAHNHVAVAEYLVRRGCPVGVVDGHNNTPLDAAAAAGHLDMIEFLLDKERKILDAGVLAGMALTRIGAGAFGDVYHGSLHGRQVAVKQIRIGALLEAHKTLEWIRQKFLVETALMNKLGGNPHFVALIGASRTTPLAAADNYWLVLEYVAGGSVFDLIHGIKPWATPPTANAIAVGLVEGMAHLHSRVPQILHRDLTSSNVLLTATGDVKIADFGISRFKAAAGDCAMTFIGNPRWRAPEVTRGEPYGAKVDVYSFGVVLWEMASGTLPFADLDNAIAALHAAKGERPPIPADCPSDWSNIIQQCWHHDPLQRPTFEELKGVVPALSPMHVAVGRAATSFAGIDTY